MLASVSERKAGRLAELGVETVLDLITTYPRRYIDRTRQADVSGLQVGEEAAVLAKVQSASARRARRAGHRRRRGARRHGPPQGRLLQPALAGQAARGGHRGDLLRQGDRVPGRPSADEPRGRRGGRRDARAKDAADLAGVPGLGQGRADVVGIGEFVTEALERAGEFADPLPVSGGLHRPVGPHGGLPGHPQARVARRRRARTPPAGLRRALPPATGPRAATAGLRGQRPRPAPRRLAPRGHRRGERHPGGAVPGRPALRAHEAQRRALAVIVADMAGPFPMHRLLQGDVGSGKTVVPRLPCSPRCRAGTRAPGWSPPRSWRSSTSRPRAPSSATLEGPGGMAGGEAQVELLTSRVKAKARARLCWRDWRRAR